MKNVFIATITIGMLAFAGCEKSGDTAQQTGATGSTSGKSSNANKKNGKEDTLGNNQVDDGQNVNHDQQQQQQQQQQTQTQTQQTQTQTQTQTQPTGTGAIQNKYANVPRMSASEKAQLVEQGYVKIDNNLNVAIVSANGQQLSRIVPPGEQLMAPRNFDTGEQVATLSLTTDDGRMCYGEFSAMDVAGTYQERMNGNSNAGADWRAAVIDRNGQCIIKQNAGGGGGGGGGGATFK